MKDMVRKTSKKNKFVELIEDIIDSVLMNDWYWFVAKRNLGKEKKIKKRGQKRKI